MGWASGSELATNLIKVIKSNVKDEKARLVIYFHLINQFENHDCDTMCECIGIDKAYDIVYNDMYPEDD